MESTSFVVQSSICAALEELDGQAKFRTDTWERENNGGGGVTKVLSGLMSVLTQPRSWNQFRGKGI